MLNTDNPKSVVQRLGNVLFNDATQNNTNAWNNFCRLAYKLTDNQGARIQTLERFLEVTQNINLKPASTEMMGTFLTELKESGLVYLHEVNTNDNKKYPNVYQQSFLYENNKYKHVAEKAVIATPINTINTVEAINKDAAIITQFEKYLSHIGDVSSLENVKKAFLCRASNQPYETADDMVVQHSLKLYDNIITESLKPKMSELVNTRISEFQRH